VGDTLSQAEIDNLLKALSAGDFDGEADVKSEQKVIDYDFRRPTKFSKEHLRTLEIIFEHYGRLVANSLPLYLRKNVQADVMNSEAVIYSEFSNALSNPVLLGIVSAAPLKGNLIIEWADNLGYTMVDRMLGGQGEPLEKQRDFTEIELTIIHRVFKAMVALLKEPWKNVIDIDPKLDKIETNSQFAQIISPGEMIAIVTMSIKIGDIEGLVNICLPFVALEPVMDRLNTKYWYSTTAEHGESYEAVVEHLISKSEIPVTAILGKSTISVNDFVNIQKGDIIKLNTKINDELDVYTGKIKKFKALPGSMADNYAVRVTSIIREE